LNKNCNICVLEIKLKNNGIKLKKHILVLVYERTCQDCEKYSIRKARYLMVIFFSAFRRFFAAHISGGTRGRWHVSMSGFADKRRTAGFTIEICQVERAGAAAQAQDPARRVYQHHRGSRASDRVYKHRRKTAGGGEKPFVFAHLLASLSTYIYWWDYSEIKSGLIAVKAIPGDCIRKLRGYLSAMDSTPPRGLCPIDIMPPEACASRFTVLRVFLEMFLHHT